MIGKRNIDDPAPTSTMVCTHALLAAWGIYIRGTERGIAVPRIRNRDQKETQKGQKVTKGGARNMGAAKKQTETPSPPVKKPTKTASKATWKKRIKAACEKAGTYQPYFDLTIDALAEILAKRDAAEQKFIETGAQMVIAHTNKGGATNAVQNPLLRIINDFNRDALAYWRDLGLTPAGLKRINDKAAKNAGNVTLEDILNGAGL